MKRTIEEIREGEHTRLAYIESRDGYPAARAFARQTYGIYRRARKTPYGKAYRAELIVSCVVFRNFLRNGSD